MAVGVAKGIGRGDARARGVFVKEIATPRRGLFGGKVLHLEVRSTEASAFHLPRRGGV